ncbi:hypothetical protein CA13_06540 [Planctomycetes bacterium CA13]|uniref:ATP-grasp fold RimK-type domain-containing protein n=1 Tax=Novipirellula herctigrandis TaxID=2527986 RepID=A0A5C5YWT5_9BACT|nr:hypothetical protein CA13_06540 [Planctomycetes bacterium CA13]
MAPRRAIRIVVKAAHLIGDGLFGVDVKESNGKFFIVEVNDSPSLDSGVEDAVFARRFVSPNDGVVSAKNRTGTVEGHSDMSSKQRRQLFVVFGVELE